MTDSSQSQPFSEHTDINKNRIGAYALRSKPPEKSSPFEDCCTAFYLPEQKADMSLPQIMHNAYAATAGQLRTEEFGSTGVMTCVSKNRELFNGNLGDSVALLFTIDSANHVECQMLNKLHHISDESEHEHVAHLQYIPAAHTATGRATMIRRDQLDAAKKAKSYPARKSRVNLGKCIMRRAQRRIFQMASI